MKYGFKLNKEVDREKSEASVKSSSLGNQVNGDSISPSNVVRRRFENLVFYVWSVRDLWDVQVHV